MKFWVMMLTILQKITTKKEQNAIFAKVYDWLKPCIFAIKF